MLVLVKETWFCRDCPPVQFDLLTLGAFQLAVPLPRVFPLLARFTLTQLLILSSLSASRPLSTLSRARFLRLRNLITQVIDVITNTRTIRPATPPAAASTVVLEKPPMENIDSTKKKNCHCQQTL